MPHYRSQPAVEALQDLQSPAIHDAVLSFAEAGNIRTAAWAVKEFGGQLLVDGVMKDYYGNPARNQAGKPIEPEELGGDLGRELRYVQEHAEQTAGEIAKDLDGGVLRIQKRGYPLETVTVRGLTDTSAVIGSLERAVEVDPGNLDEAGQHFHAAAQYMLDHMVSQNDGGTQSYLI
jgi:hypothetical protein